VRQLTRALLGAVITLLLLAGTAQAKDTLTVAHDQWIGYSGFFIAQAKGFFAAQDLDIKATGFSGPGDTLPPLLAGHVDIALTTLYNLGLVAGKGDNPLVAVYLLDTSNGADAIVAAPGITKPTELKGKAVAVTTGEVNELLLIKALESAGLTEKDIRMVNMNADDAGAALLAKRVDAAVTWEPWVSKAKSAGGNIVFSSRETPNLILDAVTVTPQTLSAKRDAVVRFLRALDQGVAYLRAHPDESRAIIGNALSVPAGDVTGMLAGDKIYSSADNKELMAAGGPGFRSVEEVAKFLTSHELINRKLDSAALLTDDLLP